jgi:hypothetical protein
VYPVNTPFSIVKSEGEDVDLTADFAGVGALFAVGVLLAVDLLDEVDSDEVLYLELKDGAADVLIRMDAFIPNPVAVRGEETEITKIENWLCRKVR